MVHEEVDVNCIHLDLPDGFDSRNNYQMIYLGNINKFRDSSNCFRFNDWINQELYYFERKNDFLDTLYQLEEVRSFVDTEYQDKEHIRLFKYNFSFGSGEIEMIDCINNGMHWSIINRDISFNRNCNLPMVSFKDHQDFSSLCFTVNREKTKTVSIDEFDTVRKAMYDTDFLNIAYFDTGAISICDGYDIQIIYDGKSSVIDSRREFYRSCPGERSPIGIVSDAILGL